VVDHSLEGFQQNQGQQISKAIIMQSEQQEQKMQASWQKQYLVAQGYLVNLLRILDKDYDEACEKSSHPLESFSAEDLNYLINARINALLDTIKGRDQNSEEQASQLRVENLLNRYTLLEKENISLQEEIACLRNENDKLTAHLSAINQAHKNYSIDKNEISEQKDVIETMPDWFSSWQASKGYKRSSMAIMVMGDTGKALRPSIIKEMAKRLSLSVVNHSLDEAINRILIVDEQLLPALIERIECYMEKGASSGGNHPDILRLTKDGDLVYKQLAGKMPEENEYERLIRSHSSPEHTILNLQVNEVLVENGYLIQGQVQEIQLSDGSTYIPDVSAINPETGEIIFIEVERDTKKDYSTRKQKWMKQYEATNGKLFVFCDNLSCQRTIQGEINLALGEMKFESFLTNLHSLRNGKRSMKNDSIWLSERRGR
jgi:hypothetical protein